MLSFFRLANRGIKPVLTGPERILSVIFVKDLVKGILLAGKSNAVNETFNIAHDEPVTWGEFADIIAEVLGKKTIRVPVPPRILWGAAAVNEFGNALLGKTTIFNRQKVREMRQISWVCDTGKSMRTLGYKPEFTLRESIEITARWYQENGWLR
jgi:nucleoside-diphosphate-sugar epimerase